MSCSLPATHEDPVDVVVKAGDTLTLRVPCQTNIWHRTFKVEGEEEEKKEYVEAPNQYLEISNKWRSGTLGKDINEAVVTVAEDGTLEMPSVSPADSAQYYTYYRGEDGIHHYSYFNVKVE